MSHSKLDVAKHWSAVVMLSIASGVAATGTNPVPELPEPVEPGCYRGRYVAPVDSAAGADPYAPRNLSTTLRHRRLRFTEQSLLLWMWQVG